MKDMVDLHWVLIVVASLAGAADAGELSEDEDDNAPDAGMMEADYAQRNQAVHQWLEELSCDGRGEGGLTVALAVKEPLEAAILVGGKPDHASAASVVADDCEGAVIRERGRIVECAGSGGRTGDEGARLARECARGRRRERERVERGRGLVPEL